MSMGTLHMQEMDSLFLCSIFVSLFFFHVLVVLYGLLFHFSSSSLK
jgi:hypothetical protein